MFDMQIPLFHAKVAAGFPSPADDYSSVGIDLNAILIENEPATFVTQASGDSMEGIGIFDGDLVIVNRSLTARNGSLIVAEVLGDFTLKRLRILEGKPWLYPENKCYSPMKITPAMNFTVWGVVKHTIRIHHPQAT